MPLVTQQFDPIKGPYIDVFLSKPKSVTFRPEEIAQSTQKLTMLIDTGASKTAISKKMADKMVLLSVGKTPLKSATHIVDANNFYVDLKCHLFAPCLEVPDLKVVEFAFADGWIDGFLGRDFLDKLIFSINGPAKTFTLAI